MRDWSEERLVDVDLGVSVNRIVADVEELDDLGFWELFDNAFATALIFNQLAGNLHTQVKQNKVNDAKFVAWEPTFFIDLIRGFAAIPPWMERVLLFMLSECSLNFLYFQLLTLSS